MHIKVFNMVCLPHSKHSIIVAYFYQYYCELGQISRVSGKGMQANVQSGRLIKLVGGKLIRPLIFDGFGSGSSAICSVPFGSEPPPPPSLGLRLPLSSLVIWRKWSRSLTALDILFAAIWRISPERSVFFYPIIIPCPESKRESQLILLTMAVSCESQGPNLVPWDKTPYGQNLLEIDWQNLEYGWYRRQKSCSSISRWSQWLKLNGVECA